MYVVGYMMKSEKAMGELLKQVAKECQNESIAVQLKKIRAAFIGKRVVGMPESVMRQNSMWMIKKKQKGHICIWGKMNKSVCQKQEEIWKVWKMMMKISS